MGYHRAGFEVVGVDIANEVRYPFEFHRGDALEFLAVHGDEFDAIHASPPCQQFTRAGHLMRAQGHTSSKADLIEPTRALLLESGLPWVMENVPGAPMLNPLMLCGSTFGLRVRRHRWFESSCLIFAAGACRHAEQGKPVGIWGRMGDKVPHGGHTATSIDEARQAMGIDWMLWGDMVEAIPPAYTEFIGRQIIYRLTVAA